MKILNVNFTFNTIGKALSDELLNIKELQKRGHHVSIVTADVAQYIIDMKKKTGNDRFVFQEDKPTEIFGIPVYILHCTIPQLAWYCPGANRLADKIVKDFDVIHIRNWYHHLALVFYKAARKYGIPFVFTAHGTMDPVVRKKYMRRTKWLIDNIYTKKMIREASALHSLGESERKEFTELGADPQKIFRIDLGVVLKDFEMREKTNILDRLAVNKESRPYLLYLGRINKKKGIELLLQAFARLRHPNLNLVIAGGGPEPYEQKIKNLVHDLGLDSSVKFAGPVFGDQKSQLLTSAKMFALTSYSDIHPVAVEEALALGLPVLITRNCDFPEIEEYEAGIIVEADVNSVYHGLLKMTGDDNKLKVFSKNARKLVLDKFLFEGKVEKYEEMFRYAVANNRSSHSSQSTK